MDSGTISAIIVAILSAVVSAYTAYKQGRKVEAEATMIQAQADGVRITGHSELAGMSLEFVDKTMTRNDTYLKRIEEQATELAELRARMGTLERELARRDEIISRREETITQQAAEITILKRELNRLNKKVNGHDSDIKSLKKGDTGDLPTPPPHVIPDDSNWAGDPPPVDEPPSD